MKQGSFRAVRLVVVLIILLNFTVFPALGDESTTNLESIILETFDGVTAHEWSVGGKTYAYEFEWAVDASKFASKTVDQDGNEVAFPRVAKVPSWPMALFGVNRDGRDINSLGIWGKFDRRGYNWVDIYPIVAGSRDGSDGPVPFEIPIPGRIQYMDVWVWGCNLNYYMEAFFRDHQGVVHTIRVGDLGFQGWKNMRLRVPTSIPQSKRVLPHYAGLSFVKFRIWTIPTERVDNFYVYFKQMKVLTDTFESPFDGEDLADADRVQELWAQN